MSLSERARKVSNSISAPHVPLTRRDLLIGGFGIGIGAVGVASLGIEGGDNTQKAGVENVFIVDKTKRLQITPPEISEIKDHANYRNAAKDLQLKIFPQLNPQFLTDNPELFRVFDNLDKVPFEEVARRFVIRTNTTRSETGYKNGGYNDSAFYIRNEDNEAILMGFIDDPDQEIRIDIQLDESRNPTQFDVGGSVKFTGLEFEELINETYLIPEGVASEKKNSHLSSLEILYKNVLDKDLRATYVETEFIYCKADSTGYLSKISNILYAKKDYNYKLERA